MAEVLKETGHGWGPEVGPPRENDLTPVNRFWITPSAAESGDLPQPGGAPVSRVQATKAQTK